MAQVVSAPIKASPTLGRQGLCSHQAHLWSFCDFVPRSEALPPPPPPGRQGLCSHHNPLWDTSNFAPRSKALGIPQMAGVM